MSDIIHLLPDHIANQIAAGEVIQRPASAVKELLENAVDASANHILLIVTDAGKALIQVIDNGKGMSETDARMAFERHATSKIQNIDDLFHIKTMGFRGEALASIAAVAQVEVKTKKIENELGTYIEIENSNVTKQEPIAYTNGTSIAMKNLFFNLPARRNFLKSNTTELKNIIDEFTRVALAFPAIRFEFTNNNQQIFSLEQGNLKQRIVQLMGNQYNSKLINVKEETDYLNITGFVGKPDIARKTRGDQFIFVNNRFIKSAYLNHAINNAFAEMLQKDSFASYFLFLDLDPAQIDINVHPTKQEIKFDDEKIVYAFVNSAVKHALAKYSITPTLDFELDATIQNLSAVSQPLSESKQNEVFTSSLYNTFTQKNQAHKVEHSGNLKNWEDFFKDENKNSSNTKIEHNQQFFIDSKEIDEQSLHQIDNSYIIFDEGSGFQIIHQQYAHQRIIYDKLVNAESNKKIAVQQSMFPETIELRTTDAVLLNDLLPELNILGYNIEPFGSNHFVVHGTPSDIVAAQSKNDIESIIEHYKNYSNQYKISKREKIALSLCWQQSIKLGTILSKKEMKNLLEDLFLCQQPNKSPFGKNIIAKFDENYLQKLFM